MRSGSDRFLLDISHMDGLINTAMILLLPVVYRGITWGRRSGLMASIAAVLALDFFFVPPQLTLAVKDLRYLPMFLVFVIVGVAIMTLLFCSSLPILAKP
jgi:K+-sensing histidine kinase KdpD